MARKQKKKPPVIQRTAPGLNEETQAAEFLTVIWTITVFTGTMTDLAAAVTRLLWTPEQRMLGILSGLLFFAAVTMGVLSLGLLPLVLRARRSPPPRAIVAFGVVVALAPLLGLAVLIFR